MVTRGWEGEKGICCLMDIDFEFYKTHNFGDLFHTNINIPNTTELCS